MIQKQQWREICEYRWGLFSWLSKWRIFTGIQGAKRQSFMTQI